MERTSYHHGRLPEALLKAAAKLVAEDGVAKLSLRELARRAGVSHGAPAHHFTDKAGLLTALAAQGYELFAEALSKARDAAGDHPLQRLAATGQAYVLFAAKHRAHFEVMFRPELLHADDPALRAAQSAAYAVLGGAIAAAQAAGFLSDSDAEVAAIRSWSRAHGLAELWLNGNLQPTPRHPDLESLARVVFPGVSALAVPKPADADPTRQRKVGKRRSR